MTVNQWKLIFVLVKKDLNCQIATSSSVTGSILSNRKVVDMVNHSVNMVVARTKHNIAKNVPDIALTININCSLFRVFLLSVPEFIRTRFHPVQNGIWTIFNNPDSNPVVNKDKIPKLITSDSENPPSAGLFWIWKINDVAFFTFFESGNNAKLFQLVITKHPKEFMIS